MIVSSLDLPEPSPEESVHTERLLAHIRAEIEQQGPMDFARFMELALYLPGLGYYSAGAQKFGAAGDFITAPELSPLFAHCLARQCAGILQALGGGEILELGAGSGRLAADLLSALAELDTLPARYAILEISADLRARQRALIATFPAALRERVVWLDAIPAQGFQGVILANEVLDALPVRRFIKNINKNIELCIDWQDGLVSCERPAGTGLDAAVQALEVDLGAPLPEGYCSEINLNLEPWLRGVGAPLVRGVALFIDYGYPRREYYHPQRSEGSLLCHYRHRAHADPLINIGVQDITASVDFTAVARAARACDLDLAGYATQAHFLIACGLAEHLHRLSSQHPGHALAYAQQAQRLTLPAEMGERFKVLALARDFHKPLLGFGFRDLRDRL
jgi:SAM-dependent MidA family methyltransferase